MTDRDPIPPGRVSRVRGRWQAPALRVVIAAGFFASLLAIVVPGRPGDAVAKVVVGLVVATPLVRVAWLVLRWAQEHDWAFVALGSLVLTMAAVGVLLA